MPRPQEGEPDASAMSLVEGLVVEGCTMSLAEDNVVEGCATSLAEAALDCGAQSP